MDLSIIIVNYKNKDKTLSCLKSIKESDLSDLLYEIIVVDNASGDESPEVIGREHPDVKIIRSEANLGMGGGNNLGAKNSQGEFILVLNPDTLVREDSIRRLYDYLKSDPRAGAVGPKLLNPDSTLQYSCLRFPKFHTPILRRTPLGALAKRHLDEFLMKDFDHERTAEVDWLIGSCLMLRRKILEEFGRLFDERFFMYFEDTDLCRRLKKNDYKVIYHPEAVVTHDHMRESASNPWYIAPLADRLAREHIKSWIKYFLTKQ